MPQNPFLTDAISFEPGTTDVGGPRVIERDPATGSLFFRDPFVPGGVTLSELAGTGGISNVLLVGTAGAGAEYTSINAAVSAVPVTSSSTNPTVILVYPGVYNEKVIIDKDGVAIIALGLVTVDAPTDGHTIVIRKGVASAPQWCHLRGIRVRNTYNSRACIFVDGNTDLNIGLERIRFTECEYVAEGLGGFQILAFGTHIIEVHEGTCEESIGPTSIRVDQCNRFTIHDVRILRDVWFAYDIACNTGGSYSAYYVPPDAENHYKISRVDEVGSTEVSCVGAGGFTMTYVQCGGDLMVAGNRPAQVIGSRVDEVSIDVGVNLKLINSSRTTAIGAGTLEESIASGSAVFIAATSLVVNFDLDQPNTDYRVLLDSPTVERPYVTNKTVSGFTINFPTVQTDSVEWTAFRSVT